MAFIDYYKILGVDRNIPQDQVREAYRKRAKLFHPDLHPNDPKAKAKFQALNEAYDVISDPEKRKKYDQYGEKWREADALHKMAVQQAMTTAATIGVLTQELVEVPHSKDSTSRDSELREVVSQVSFKTYSGQKQAEAVLHAHAVQCGRTAVR